MEDGLVEVVEKGRGGDEFFVLSVANCTLVMFSLICRACIQYFLVHFRSSHILTISCPRLESMLLYL